MRCSVVRWQRKGQPKVVGELADRINLRRVRVEQRSVRVAVVGLTKQLPDPRADATWPSGLPWRRDGRRRRPAESFRMRILTRTASRHAAYNAKPSAPLPRGCVICRAIRYPACCTAVQYSGTPVYSSMGLHRTAQAVRKRVILCLHRQPLDGLDRAARDACWREKPVVQCLAAGQRALDIGRPQVDRVLGVAATADTHRLSLLSPLAVCLSAGGTPLRPCCANARDGRRHTVGWAAASSCRRQR